MDLKIGISTCPNDIYIFNALITKKVPLNFNLKFDFFDIEELNKKCINYDYDIIKISANLFKKVKDKYFILDSGSALGFNCGPLLISKYYNTFDDLENKLIALPGENTTANRLFDIFMKKPVKKTFFRFDKIIPAILNDEVAAGVIIHEGRFIYHKYNLIKIADLGELWERNFKMPIPLGIIVAKKELSNKILNEIDLAIKKSLEYTKNKDYNLIKKFAQEMDDATIKNHIKLYVNKFSYSLGETGREAILKFLNLNDEKIFWRGEKNVSK